MKKIERKLLMLFFFAIVFLSFATNVSATSYGFTVGASLGGSAYDTTAMATYVGNQLRNMGYATVTRTGPTFSNIFTEMIGVSPTRWWLEADVIYLAGHGNYDNMSFSTTGRGGPEYDIMITNTNTWNYGPNYGNIGIGVFNLNKVSRL